MSTSLDSRLLRGMAVTIAELADVYADHYNGAGTRCPHCGHQGTEQASDCPSFTTARALLIRRRYERPGDIPAWINAQLPVKRKGRARI
jgi:hypothetical protein